MDIPVEEVKYWSAEMYPIWCGVAVIMGLFLGSFYNVCIYRIPAGMSVGKPKRSFCFRCGTAVPWYHNIPVLSYFILRGRCSSCGAGFSMRYAGVELLTGVLFLAVFMMVNPSWDEPFRWATFWYLAFVSLLLIGTFTDLDHWIIPDVVTIWGTGASLVAALVLGFVDQWPLLTLMGPFPMAREVWGEEDALLIISALFEGPVRWELDPASMYWFEPLANAVLGAVVGSFGLYAIGVTAKVVLRKDAMGFGDVLLFGMIGGTLGVLGAILTFFLACIVGAVVGVAGPLVMRMVKPPPPDVLGLGTPEGDSPLGNEAARNLVVRLRAEPPTGGLHHLPFGPSIAIAAVVVLLFHRQILDFLV